MEKIRQSVSAGGPLSREALLEEYYLNFWKEDLLVTAIGPDPEDETIQGVIAIAQAVDARIADTGERPGFASLLLSDPLAFSQPKYVRGGLGVMNTYVFDTKNVLGVRGGMIGVIGHEPDRVKNAADGLVWKLEKK